MYQISQLGAAEPRFL